MNMISYGMVFAINVLILVFGGNKFTQFVDNSM